MAGMGFDSRPVPKCVNLINKDIKIGSFLLTVSPLHNPTGKQ